MAFLHVDYIEPMGLPHYWQNESSGQLREAVRLYLQEQRVTPLLTAYLAYVVNAPCWRRNPHATPDDILQLDALVLGFSAATTAKEVRALLDSCLDLSIDPL